MTDRAALEAASKAGIINADQIGPLHDFLSGQAPKPMVTGEEDLRFIRNFHDVFLAIGIVLFAIGLSVAIGTQVAAAVKPEQGAVLTGVLTAGAAIVMWLLGEFFARRRRLFLPAIAIVCALTLFAVISAASLYFGLVLGQGVTWDINHSQGLPPNIRNGLLLAAAFMVIAPALFYARFRLPFSLGMAGGGAALFVIFASLVFNWDMTLRYLPALYLTLGALLFLAGIAFDARDPDRATRLSDNGFWLHFAAAPLILNGTFGLIGQAMSAGKTAALSPAGGMLAGGSATQAGATLIAVILLGLISLLINRRALIVSALLTTGVAIGVLLNAVGLGAGALAAATLITLGAFVLILGASWHVVRRALLGWVKPEGAWARVFPPETQAT
jgi:hypothetical protein